MTVLSFQKGYDRRQKSLAAHRAFHARYGAWVNPYASGIDGLIELPADPKPAATIVPFSAREEA